jgi:hypothetical protein
MAERIAWKQPDGIMTTTLRLGILALCEESRYRMLQSYKLGMEARQLEDAVRRMVYPWGEDGAG